MNKKMTKLEEINQLKAELKRLDTNSIHTCHDKCTRKLCVLARENKELKAQVSRLNVNKIKCLVSKLEAKVERLKNIIRDIEEE
jgi:hypothetical protein